MDVNGWACLNMGPARAAEYCTVLHGSLHVHPMKGREHGRTILSNICCYYIKLNDMSLRQNPKFLAHDPPWEFRRDAVGWCKDLTIGHRNVFEPKEL